MGGGLVQLVALFCALAALVAAAVAIWAAAILIHAAWQYAKSVDDTPDGLAHGDSAQIPNEFHASLNSQERQR